MKIHESSDDLIVELCGCWDGNAHRSSSPHEITEPQEAVSRLLCEAMGREEGESRNGVPPSLEEVLTGVLGRVELSVRVRSLLVGQVGWFKELS